MKKAIRYFLILLLLIFVSAGAFGAVVVHQMKQGELSPYLKREIRNLVYSSNGAKLALQLKSDYVLLLEELKEMDVQQAEEIQTRVDADIQALEEYFDKPIWRTAGKISTLGDELAAAKELIGIAKTANSDMIDPLLGQMKAFPLSEMKDEDGLRVNVILSYLDFAETMLPQVQTLSERLGSLDDTRILRLADSEGKIGRYSTRIKEILGALDPYLDYLPAVRSVLGDSGDRLYVFAAQNTSEIRASGGFPGSVGAIRICDGRLSIVDFQSVYNVFTGTIPGVYVTEEENYLFRGRMSLSWDAGFNPDFERVATIWALAYQNCNGEHVDGVISATPIIIQRLLSFLGDITLSDGTVLNGENAMSVLEHDLYYKYQSQRSGLSPQDGDELVDQLFAETARETLKRLFSSFGKEHVNDYLNFAKESFADRSLLIWLSDEEEQNIIRQFGWSGSLNNDETKPQIGVFFNSTSASKMGWYLDVDVFIGEATENEDYSKTYPVKVTFSNRLTSEERKIAGKYILGASGYGGLNGGMYIFAPSGGAISGVISNHRTNIGTLHHDSFHGLELLYLYDSIPMGSSIEIECDVTTSCSADEALSFIKMPTAQEYRN